MKSPHPESERPENKAMRALANGYSLDEALRVAYQAMSPEERANAVTVLANLFSALPPHRYKASALAYREAILEALNSEPEG